MGVQPDSRVALCVERSHALVIGILAILKAGGAYVPLDPAYASERLKDILNDADPTIVLADKTGRAALGQTALSSMRVFDPNTQLNQPTSNPQVPRQTSRDLAYIIYTSGSTGKPKGVMIEHRSVVNYAKAHIKFSRVRNDSRVLLFASICFDASVADIVLPLSSGATLYIPLDSTRLDRDKLWEYMTIHSITHAAMTPSFLQDGKDLPIIHTPLTLILGGEPLYRALLLNLIAQGYNVLKITVQQRQRWLLSPGAVHRLSAMILFLSVDPSTTFESIYWTATSIQYHLRLWEKSISVEMVLLADISTGLS
jgi:pristinamycin I synthase-3/4